MATQRIDDRIGTTVGLVQTRDSRLDAEQVYVSRTGEDSSTHDIEIDAWVGYSSVGKIRLTRRQAKELIPLLLDGLIG